MFSWYQVEFKSSTFVLNLDIPTINLDPNVKHEQFNYLFKIKLVKPPDNVGLGFRGDV
jgi:hypothetical protein